MFFTVGGQWHFFKVYGYNSKLLVGYGQGIVSKCILEWDLLVTIKSVRVAEVGVIFVGLLNICANLAFEIMCFILLLSDKILSLKCTKI